MFLHTVWVFSTILMSQIFIAKISSDYTNTIKSNSFVCNAPGSCKAVKSKFPRTVVLLANGLEVMCDTKTERGGWVVIQRRFDGHLDFYRGWEEYKFGFGDFNKGEFYLGNEKIHQLTISRRHALRIDFKFNGKNYYAKYARFQLYSELEGYRLKVSGYSGNAGDALTKLHNDQKFSTFDRDNDTEEKDHCARHFNGGWWYSDCHEANLNGLWKSDESGKGLIWVPTTGQNESATFTEMKIKPIY
ncbi:ficolin-1-like [Physella acuta]|uniref:ficolin-1-like n=1 Tax=Physella acuta TaxID=109671 RepID=UPI0027DE9B4C|nr:ficolin-1-like [Physella acuta]